MGHLSFPTKHIHTWCVGRFSKDPDFTFSGGLLEFDAGSQIHVPQRGSLKFEDVKVQMIGSGMDLGLSGFLILEELEWDAETIKGLYPDPLGAMWLGSGANVRGVLPALAGLYSAGGEAETMDLGALEELHLLPESE